jgi:DNA-directed RNA polymerase subunit RPC12/RpoP
MGDLSGVIWVCNDCDLEFSDPKVEDDIVMCPRCNCMTVFDKSDLERYADAEEDA